MYADQYHRDLQHHCNCPIMSRTRQRAARNVDELDSTDSESERQYNHELDHGQELDYDHEFNFDSNKPVSKVNIKLLRKRIIQRVNQMRKRARDDKVLKGELCTWNRVIKQYELSRKDN